MFYRPVFLLLVLLATAIPASYGQSEKLDSLVTVLLSSSPDSVFETTSLAFRQAISRDTLPANKQKALNAFQAHEIYSLIRKDLKECGRANSAIAELYEGQLIMDSTLMYAFRAAEYYESAGEYDLAAQVHYRMTRIYFYKGNLTEANRHVDYQLDYYEKTADRNAPDLAKAYMLKAVVLHDIPDSVAVSDKFYRKAIESAEKDNFAMLGILYNNYAEFLDITDAPEEDVMTFFDKAIDNAAFTGDSSVVAYAAYGKAKIHFRNKKYDTAIRITEPMLYFWKNTNRVNDLLNAYDLLYQCYEGTGDYRNTAYYLKKKMQLSDSLTKLTNSLNLSEMDEKFKLEKQDKELAELKRISTLEQLEKEKHANRNFQLMIGIVLSLLVGGFSLYAYANKQKTNKLLTAEKKRVEEQNQMLEEKNREILDSITYAKRIQKAILPADDFFRENFKESFVLYRPKDIVAGDFFWLYKKDGLTFLAVCDCTGHGVPGALVSVVCSNSLERAVNEFNLREPAAILDKTRELVKASFQGSPDNVSDGMDISLICMPDARNGESVSIRYAGANTPLWYVEDGQLKEISPDKQPIGNFVRETPFTNHEIEVRKDTMFYLFSDGYADQFGGPSGKKYKYKQLGRLLAELVNLPGRQQKEQLETAFNQWKGDLEQVDDVCVIGVRL